MGAVLVSAWLHDYAPKIRCAVLASPAFKVKLYVPLARSGLKLMHKWRGNFFVNSYVKSHYLTHNKARQQSYDSDPIIARAISVRILLGLYEASERVVADAQAVTTPVQLLISGSDWVVHHKPQHDFYNRLGSRIKERHILKGFYHDTLWRVDNQPCGGIFGKNPRLPRQKCSQDVQSCCAFFLAGANFSSKNRFAS